MKYWILLAIISAFIVIAIATRSLLILFVGGVIFFGLLVLFDSIDYGSDNEYLEMIAEKFR